VPLTACGDLTSRRCSTSSRILSSPLSGSQSALREKDLVKSLITLLVFRVLKLYSSEDLEEKTVANKFSSLMSEQICGPTSDLLEMFLLETITLKQFRTTETFLFSEDSLKDQETTNWPVSANHLPTKLPVPASVMVLKVVLQYVLDTL